MGDITNVMVYVNEQIPTYDSTVCEVERKRLGTGGMIGIIVAVLLLTCGCLFGCSKMSSSSKKYQRNTELKSVEPERMIEPIS